MSDTMSDKLIVGGYTLISVGLPDLLPQSQHRTPGIHVSDIIHYLCVKLGYRKDNRDLSPSTISRMQLGCAFEDTIARRLEQDNPSRYFRPGEIECDSIYGHPDLIDCWDGAVEEDKLTWAYSKQKPGSKKFWPYEVQLKAYCYMLGMPFGRLRVCHINGDGSWEGPESGVYCPLYERHYTEKELRENWEMLLTAANSRQFPKKYSAGGSK